VGKLGKRFVHTIDISACARNGIHYVDITGETPWIYDIINK
jgi:short subunit dehydrogenase-like uncharacterized protein